MSIATEQEQLDYFYKRVESIKQSKLYAKHALIPEEYLVPTREEMVQALIDGSATLRNTDNTGPIYFSELNWPDLTIKAQERKEQVAKAQDDYDAYHIALSESISKIVDKVVLGKLKPLEAIEQIEQLA
jgi:hypothetical protein